MKRYTVIGLAALALIIGTVWLWQSRSGQQGTKDYQTLMESAQMYYRIGEYGRALQLFGAAKTIAEKQKNQEEAAFARYSIATTHWLRSPDSNPELAAKEFAALLKEEPKGGYAPWCKLALTRMQHLVDPGNQPDYDKILREYLDIYNEYPTNIAGQEALLYRVATLQSRFEDENFSKLAREEIRSFLKKYPDSVYRSSFWGQLSTAENALGNCAESLSCRIRALETSEIDPTNPKQDNSNNYWYIATYAEFTVGDFTTARKYYELLQSEYPRDRRNFAALRALARMKKVEEEFRAGKTPEALTPAAKGADDPVAPPVPAQPAGAAPATSGGAVTQ